MRGVIIVSLVLAICSCRSVKYIPVETVRTDSVYVNKLHRDSVHVRDSVFLLVKGDTMWVEKYKYLYKDRVLRDTVRVVERDTTQVIVQIEKELTRWQRFKMRGFWILFVVFAVCVLKKPILNFVKRLI